MEINEFEELVDKGIAEIPQKFLKKLGEEKTNATLTAIRRSRDEAKE